MTGVQTCALPILFLENKVGPVLTGIDAKNIEHPDALSNSWLLLLLCFLFFISNLILIPISLSKGGPLSSSQFINFLNKKAILENARSIEGKEGVGEVFNGVDGGGSDIEYIFNTKSGCTGGNYYSTSVGGVSIEVEPRQSLEKTLIINKVKQDVKINDACPVWVKTKNGYEYFIFYAGDFGNACAGPHVVMAFNKSGYRLHKLDTCVTREDLISKKLISFDRLSIDFREDLSKNNGLPDSKSKSAISTFINKPRDTCKSPVVDVKLSNGLLDRYTVFVDSDSQIIIYLDTSARSSVVHVFDFNNEKYGQLFSDKEGLLIHALPDYQSLVSEVDLMKHERSCNIKDASVTVKDLFSCTLQKNIWYSKNAGGVGYVCKWLYK